MKIKRPELKDKIEERADLQKSSGSHAIVDQRQPPKGDRRMLGMDPERERRHATLVSSRFSREEREG